LLMDPLDEMATQLSASAELQRVDGVEESGRSVLGAKSLLRRSVLFSEGPQDVTDACHEPESEGNGDERQRNIRERRVE